MTKIHPTAIIEPGAELDETVEVSAFAYIGAHVQLHRGVKVGHHALVEGHTKIGAETKIYAHAKLGVTPQDLKYKGEPGRLILGERNMIRESASIEFGTEGGGMETRLGNDNLLMINAHIAHDADVGDRLVLGMCAGTAGHVTIGSGVRISSLAGIHQFVHLGDMSYIGLSAIVNRNVLPYSLINQNSELIGLNLTGMRRSDMSVQAIKEVKDIYQLLYQNDSSEVLTERMEELQNLTFSTSEAQEMQKFALNQHLSGQGLITPVKKK